MISRTAIRLLSLVVALVGAWVLWNSPVWGLQGFDRILQQFEGGLGGEQLALALAGSIATFRLIGAILLGVGLFRALSYTREDLG